MGLTSDPNEECLNEILSSGQQACYLVMSDEERAKGFIRPIRRSYQHITCGTVTTMAQAIAETYARDPHFYGGTFCCGCGTHFPLLARNPDGEDNTMHRRQFAWIGGDGQQDGTFVGQ